MLPLYPTPLAQRAILDFRLPAGGAAFLAASMNFSQTLTQKNYIIHDMPQVINQNYNDSGSALTLEPLQTL